MRLNRGTTGIKISNAVHYSIEIKSCIIIVIHRSQTKKQLEDLLIPTIEGNRTKLYQTSRKSRKRPCPCTVEILGRPTKELEYLLHRKWEPNIRDP
jgi:hypothetical protein